MAKLSIGLMDRWGDLHSVAHRLSQEGHAVTYHIRTTKPENARIGDGIVRKVSSVAGLVEQHPDVIVAYQSPEQAAALHAAKVPVWGSSETSRLLEEDRAAALKLARDSGMAVSATNEFDSMADAYDFLDTTPLEEWVFKAEGADNECSTTHVCKSREGARAILSTQSKAKRFILQEVVHGVEVSCEGWYDYRQGWLHPYNSTLERKRLMPGDVGPNTGCMGSVVWAWPRDAQLPQETVQRFTTYLDRARYVGPFDVNSIIGTCSLCGKEHDLGVPHWLEFTPRLGWNAFEAAMMLIPEGKLGEWFVALGRGEAQGVPMQPETFGMAVRVLIKRAKDVPVIAPWRSSRNVFVKDVWHDGTTLRSTGTDTDCGFTVVFELGAAASTIYNAAQAIYKTILPRVTVPDPTYRDDIGEHAERDINQLAGYEIPGRVIPMTIGPSTVYATPSRERAARSA